MPAEERRLVGRVHLVRHGEVENPSRVVYGALPGFSLSRRGRDQALLAARRLDSILGETTSIVASPLERAQETALILHEALRAQRGTDKPSLDERLIEARSGFDGLPRKFDVQKYARRWFDPEARRHRESPRRVAERMMLAIDDARGAAVDDVVIVSHQFPIQVLTAVVGRESSMLRRYAPWLFIRSRCTLASITTLTFDGDRIRETSYWEPP